MRDDDDVLIMLGLSEDDRRTMGLDAPAEGSPDKLTDVYLRRSKKGEDLTTMRAHLKDVVRWAASQGVAVRRVWLEQRSASKAYKTRTVFEAAIKSVIEGKSRTLAVWKTDRFDRRGMGTVGTVLDDFERKRARLVSVTESLDSSVPGMRIVFAILAERARAEAEDIAKRTQIGHTSHKSEDRRGTGTPPFGLYSKRGSGKVEPHQGEYEVARFLAERLLENKSQHEAARLANAQGFKRRSGKPWTFEAVGRMFNSPLLGGMVPFRERLTDDDGMPIDRWAQAVPVLSDDGKPRTCGTGVVTVSEWYQIQAYRRGRSSEEWGRGKKLPGVLGTGFYRCHRCQGPMDTSSSRYSCHLRNTGGLDACLGTNCSTAPTDTVMGEVWVRHVSSMPPDAPVLDEISRRWLRLRDPVIQEQHAQLSESLHEAKRRIERLDDDYYVHGAISEDRYQAVSERQAALVGRLSLAIKQLRVREDELMPFLEPAYLAEAWEGSDIQTRRMLLECTIDVPAPGERSPNKGVLILGAKHQGDRTPMLNRMVFNWL